MSNSQETEQKTSQAILQALQHLIDVVAQLRSPDGGCPWDLQQTPQTLIPYIIEEAYEVVHALQTEDQDAITEELGDLLLQVVLQAQIAQEYGHFSLQDIAQNITQKLIRRHPHVFGNVAVTGVEEVRQNWELIKAEEKGEDPQKSQLLSVKLSRYARTLPPLMASLKMSQKAAAAGFEWDDAAGVWAKFEEELAEFKESLETDDIKHQRSELGDLLFTLVNIARWYNLDPSEALQDTNQKFIKRLQLMEKFADRPLDTYNLQELDQFWQQAKSKIRESE